MESPAFKNGSSNRYQSGHHHFKEPRHPSPRLPTPENSRSSNDAFDQSPLETVPPERDLSLQPSHMGKSGIAYMPKDAQYFRYDSQARTVPETPPLRVADAQKPLLPSLKTVLGDRMSSPPRTPSPEGNLQQPSPREPSYITSTYMPPALYPNKKQRTEPCSRTLPPQNHSGRLKTPLPPTRTLEPPPSEASRGPTVRFPPLSTTLNGIETRRASSSIHSPCWSAQFPPQIGVHDTAASHYRTPEQTPTCSLLEPAVPRLSTFPNSVQDPFGREMRDSILNISNRSVSRRSSASGYSGYSVHPYEREFSQSNLYQRGTRYSVSTRDAYATGRGDVGAYERGEEHSQRVNSYGQASFPSTTHAFFMPSHYEYQHGKARKRSNLPKQSTEIMKTWFDQNITNPYPSEEQKAIFSNATGISMTQVSNWFINHRRRCPELRDKREQKP